MRLIDSDDEMKGLKKSLNIQELKSIEELSYDFLVTVFGIPEEEAKKAVLDGWRIHFE